MKLHPADLSRAETAGVLQAGQADALWRFLAAEAAAHPSFRFAHVLYYLGGMIAIAAMTLFMSVGYQTWGPMVLTVFSVCYGFLAWRLGVFFLGRQLIIPAGILFTLSIALVPLAVYGIEAALGHWEVGGRYSDYHHYVDWRWLSMELATLLAGSVMLWRYRLPFMVMPVAVTLWYLSMDMADWLLTGLSVDDWGDDWLLRKWVSVVVGLMMLALALRVDLKSQHTRGDYAFWLYLFGLLAFWGGLSSMNSGSELGKAIYCAINVGLILIGAVLARRAFAVFGGLGVTAYLGHLAYGLFKDSLLFAFALSLIGLAIVFAGVWWNKHGEALGARWRRAISPKLAALIGSRQP
ncbi:DUF2157 domain-containing protein [Chitinimonas arctica]|uniref:DUF2157 domain-containing protein n=1 Tax=Chitinimonas arctica TaxID=2594795 RepID=A0A516SJV0_9NEIS|nr:DUF2157 domain-containing protein [Chitinimonas arctica]QDQ28426.1 DUF2157 domain-containing protein [Chitinimonas arctica]